MNPACVTQTKSETSEHLSVIVKENARFLVELRPFFVTQTESEPREPLSVVVKENAHFLVELLPFFAGQGAVVAGGLSVTKVDEEAGILQKHRLKQGACKIQLFIIRLALMRK